MSIVLLKSRYYWVFSLSHERLLFRRKRMMMDKKKTRGKLEETTVYRRKTSVSSLPPHPLLGIHCFGQTWDTVSFVPDKFKWCRRRKEEIKRTQWVHKTNHLRINTSLSFRLHALFEGVSMKNYEMWMEIKESKREGEDTLVLKAARKEWNFIPVKNCMS